MVGNASEPNAAEEVPEKLDPPAVAPSNPSKKSLLSGEEASATDAPGNAETTTQSTHSKGRVRREGERNTIPSSKLRLILAGVLSVVALLVVAASFMITGTQPRNLLILVTVGIGVITVSVESLSIFKARKWFQSPFIALPLLGCAAISLSAALIALSEEDAVSSWGAVAAPVWAAVVVVLGNGLFLKGSLAGRKDPNYLYPPSFIGEGSSRLGEVIECSPGDVISVDGRIQRGCIAIDERRFSPVGAFRIREEEEIVFAGSTVLAGSASIVALSSQEDSALRQLQDALTPLVQESQGALEEEDVKSSRWSSLSILFLSVAAGIFWNERSTGLSQALLAGGTVALFGSVCMVGGLLYGLRRELVQKWAARGYIFGTSGACKHLAAIRSVEIDPSRCGEGSFLRAESLDILDDRLSQGALCEFLCALLGRAEDPILAAAGDYCRKNVVTPSVERVVDLREYEGRGICGAIHGVELSIGTEDFLVERGIMVQPSDGRLSPEVDTKLVLVAIDDDVIARINIVSHQKVVVNPDAPIQWEGGTTASLAPGVGRTLGDDVLLIRGRESALLGQSAEREMTFFDLNDGIIRRSTLLSFSPQLEPLQAILCECQRHIRSVDRFRLLVGFGGLALLVAVFVGIATPVIPLILVVSVSTLVHLSHRRRRVLVS